MEIAYDDSNRSFLREMRILGCDIISSEAKIIVPDNKKPNVSEVINFYSHKPKNFTPYQKKAISKISENLPKDIFFKKTDKGIFLVDENGLLPKNQLLENLPESTKLVRKYNDTRFLIKIL
jgi:hypothetical protein